MVFGKLISGRIQLFVNPLHIDGNDVFTNDPELLLQYGYKQVVYTDPPSEVPEGYMPQKHWEETDRKITQIWTLVPIYGQAE